MNFCSIVQVHFQQCVRKDRWILKIQIEYLLWVIVGGVTFWVELLLLCMSSNCELLKETVVLSAVPAALFWAIDRYGKEKPFYFLRSAVCIWAGRGVFDIVLYCVDGREITRFMLFWQVMLTLLLFCMKFIQMVYDRVPDKKAYFGHVLIGIVLAFNAAYIARMYDSFPRSAGVLSGVIRDIYVLEHGTALLIVAAFTLCHYQRRYKLMIKNNTIRMNAYLFNALKMTLVSFVLFVYPLYELFLSE